MDENQIYIKICEIHKLWAKGEYDKIDFKDYFEKTNKFVKMDLFLSSEKRQISTDIACIIQDTARDKLNRIEPDSFSNIISTLVILAEKNPSEFKHQDYEDPVLTAINTALGNIYMAIISFCLRWCKVFGKVQGQQTFPLELKNFFESELAGKKERPPEFDTIMGLELNNLEYLDTNWVKNWIDSIFPKSNDIILRRALIGYLYNPNPLSKELYTLLKCNNVFHRAIHEKLPERCIRTLIWEIIVGYSEGVEIIDTTGNLVDELIQYGNEEHIMYLIHQYWQFRSNSDFRVVQKVKPLWRKLVNHLIEEGNSIGRNRLLAHLSWWVELFDYIDTDIIDLLKPSLNVISMLDAIRLLEIFKSYPSKDNWELILPLILIKVENPEYMGKYLKPALDFIREKFQYQEIINIGKGSSKVDVFDRLLPNKKTSMDKYLNMESGS